MIFCTYTAVCVFKKMFTDIYTSMCMYENVFVIKLRALTQSLWQSLQNGYSAGRRTYDLAFSLGEGYTVVPGHATIKQIILATNAFI